MIRHGRTDDRTGTAGDAGSGQAGVQERLESSVLGRVAISAAIIYVLAALLITNLPPSELKSTGQPAVERFLEATALSQSWNLFAPSPRRSTLRLTARLVYSDGTQASWHQPEGDALVGQYRSYRWRKWASNLLSDSRNRMWPQAARWIAESNRLDGHLPVEVTLVRQFYYAPRPGSGERELPPWREDILYTARYQEGA